MQTKITQEIDDIVKTVCDGGLIAYPSELGFELGCSPFHNLAVQRLLRTFQRTIDTGDIILTSDSFRRIESFIDAPDLYQLSQRITLCDTHGLPASRSVPFIISGHKKTVLFRVSSHSVVKRICTNTGEPLASIVALNKKLDKINSAEELDKIFFPNIDIIFNEEVSFIKTKKETVHDIDKNNEYFFISYSSKDGDFADTLKKEMESSGFKVWMDIDSIGVGSEWRKELDDSLFKTKALILIVSPDSQKSKYVTYEWSCALCKGIPVIPLLLRKAKLHQKLESLQAFDFSSDNRRFRPWDQFFHYLRKTF